MKNIKKLLSIVMVLAMVLALGASAFAATVTIVPAGDPNGDMGNTYYAWQIFAGSTGQTSTATQKDNKDWNAQLGNIAWGDAIKDRAADYLTALDGAGFKPVTPDAKGVAELLGNTDSSAIANKFAEVTYNFVKNTDPQATLVKGENNIASGYWLIVEAEDGSEGKIINPALLQLTDEGDVTIKQKAEQPSVDKTVEDVNDSHNVKEDGDSADYDVGDVIPYTLTATLGTGYALYETYYLQFVDTMSGGLTYNDDAKVYIKGADGADVDVTDFFVIAPDGVTPGATLTVTCLDLKQHPELAGLTDGDQIVVKYTATLNENAIVGPDGNTNDVYLRFERDPHDQEHGEPDKPGTTPKDTVIVFTFDQEVIKVDGKMQPLAGAVFTLYKKVQEGTVGADKLEGAEGFWKALSTKAVTGPEGGVYTDGVTENVFNFDKIDDGIYKLRETVTPAGYNTAPDIDFEITATHEDPDKAKAEGREPLTSFDVKLWNEETKAYDLPYTGTFTVLIKDDGMISGTVKNVNGLELPETGGIGTTIFYVVGAILVVGAVILLVTRKRANDATK